MKIYPNPGHGDITVITPDILSAKIELLDILGKVVTTQQLRECGIGNHLIASYECLRNCLNESLSISYFSMVAPERQFLIVSKPTSM